MVTPTKPTTPIPEEVEDQALTLQAEMIFKKGPKELVDFKPVAAAIHTAWRESTTAPAPPNDTAEELAVLQELCFLRCGIERVQADDFCREITGQPYTQLQLRQQQKRELHAKGLLVPPLPPESDEDPDQEDEETPQQHSTITKATATQHGGGSS